MVVPDDVLVDHSGFDQFQEAVSQSYGTGRQRAAFEDDAIFEIAVSFDLNRSGFSQQSEFAFHQSGARGLFPSRIEHLGDNRRFDVDRIGIGNEQHTDPAVLKKLDVDAVAGGFRRAAVVPIPGIMTGKVLIQAGLLGAEYSCRKTGTGQQ